MFTPSARNAEKVALLCEALEGLSPGETITYTQLSRAAGEKITGGSYLLQRALAHSEKRTGAIFDNVHGKGYQRLAAQDVPGVGKKANTRIRRVARKARKRFEGIRANDLTSAEIASFAAYRSHFGMMEAIATERAVKALEVGIDAPPPVTTLKDRMAAFMRGDGK